MKLPNLLPALALLVQPAIAREFHVSVKGNDDTDGSSASPLKTISAAARLAQPGDVITVHEGTYRERITPPRGGASDAERIVYQAAPGERVIIKGSEVARDWKQFAPGVWKLTLPNSFFGRYNPYKDLIAGDWFTDKGRPHHTGEVYLNGRALWETHLLERVLHPQPYPDARDPEGARWSWFCESDDKNTYIYANFHDQNPNEELVEINVRDSCFYPDQPGRNYITVRGFRLCHAATQWAAPTAEQIGLIGTHWSKGWIIENNVISDSKCSGITLGKERRTGHNVWKNDPCKDGSIHYNEVVKRAFGIDPSWSRENIGSHLVRSNVIFDCEQTGICGSLGAVFSTITRNHIYNIWTRRQFAGAEMGGIKLHAAIDVRIAHNRIHNAGRGLWMDWMAQGTRISGNLLYDNTTEDLFMEVDHGPYLVDNNLLLSRVSLYDMSQGGAFAHNLFAGKITSRPELRRSTPYHLPHATALAGLTNIHGGDNRFFNNVFVGAGASATNAHFFDSKSQFATGFGLWVYDTRPFPVQTGGNAYFNSARPYTNEANALLRPDEGLKPEVREEAEKVYLQLQLPSGARAVPTVLVTSALLGKALIPDLAYENPDGSPLTVAEDYFGKPRAATRPAVGPFEQADDGALRFRVW